MSIVSIEAFRLSNQKLYVEAVVDDMVLLHRQTMLEPEEWGPALCYATIDLNDYEDCDKLTVNLQTTEAVLDFIQSVNPTWILIDNSDYDLDYYD